MLHMKRGVYHAAARACTTSRQNSPFTSIISNRMRGSIFLQLGNGCLQRVNYRFLFGVAGRMESMETLG